MDISNDGNTPNVSISPQHLPNEPNYGQNFDWLKITTCDRVCRPENADFLRRLFPNISFMKIVNAKFPHYMIHWYSHYIPVYFGGDLWFWDVRLLLRHVNYVSLCVGIPIRPWMPCVFIAGAWDPVGLYCEMDHIFFTVCLWCSFAWSLLWKYTSYTTQWRTNENLIISILSRRSRRAPRKPQWIEKNASYNRKQYSLNCLTGHITRAFSPQVRFLVLQCYVQLIPNELTILCKCCYLTSFDLLIAAPIVLYIKSYRDEWYRWAHESVRQQKSSCLIATWFCLVVITYT